MEGLRVTLREALALLAFLTIPSTLGLLVLGEPVVRLLYERGRFTTTDTTNTAAALACYGVGLVAYTGVKVLAPAFYALGSARVPLLGTVLAVLTNVTVMVVGFPTLSFRAVALGTGLGSLVNAVVLFVVFERRVGGLRGSGLGRRVLRIVGAALVMGAIVFWTAGELTRLLGTKGFLAQAVIGLVPVVVGVVAYEAAALLLKIPEARTVLRLVRPRPPGMGG
jgi:putative peptidoglycan lipid II flippase